MITREELKSHWHDVKDRLRQNWRELSESELARFNGTPRELIDVIQRKTGASWSEIESFLGKIMRDTWSTASQAKDIAGQYGGDASQFARNSYDQIAALTADCSQKVVDTVKRRPVESLAVAFGVGIIAGAIVWLSYRRQEGN